MLRKLLCVLVAAGLILSLAACGASKTRTAEESSQAESQEEESSVKEEKPEKEESVEKEESPKEESEEGSSEEKAAEEEAEEESVEEESQQAPEAIKPSPDKYTWYLQDYRGRNVASIGYTSLGGDRLEKYGSGHIELSFLTKDGSYINIDDEDELKEYVVVEQSYEPNTEIKYTFMTDSDGEEYSNLIQWQNIEQVDLLVRKLDDKESVETTEMVNIQPSEDRYTYYIRNYVGKNLANVGYTSIGDERLDEYGEGHLQFCIVADDGSYVDITNEEQIKEYVIVGQNIAPNTPLKYTYTVDSEGNEYENLVSWKSIDQIDLLVQHIGSELNENAPEMVAIDPAPDKYTNYIRNYVGKNLGNVGYTSIGGDRNDEYGEGYLELVIVSDSGEYVDPEDEDQLKNYIITSQDIAPNTEITMTYLKDSDGKEYENLVDEMSFEKITLYVTRINGSEEIPEENSAESSEESEQPAESEESEESEETEDKEMPAEESEEEGSTDSEESVFSSIYEEYSQKLSDQTAVLIEEYNEEAKDLDISGKAELCNDKVEVLAEISTEGTEKMAELMWEKGTSYSEYSEWSGKLMDDYLDCSQQIYDAYMDSIL